MAQTDSNGSIANDIVGDDQPSTAAVLAVKRGRGRPKKTESSDKPKPAAQQAEAEKAKGKRGRPPKPLAKGKRGRPTKASNAAPDSSPESSPPQKAAPKPKKNLLTNPPSPIVHSNAPSSEVAGASSLVAKKPRGRPRKA